jgi:hypothetical protein
MSLATLTSNIRKITLPHSAPVAIKLSNAGGHQDESEKTVFGVGACWILTRCDGVPNLSSPPSGHHRVAVMILAHAVRFDLWQWTTPFGQTMRKGSFLMCTVSTRADLAGQSGRTEPGSSSVGFILREMLRSGAWRVFGRRPNRRTTRRQWVRRICHHEFAPRFLAVPKCVECGQDGAAGIAQLGENRFVHYRSAAAGRQAFGKASAQPVDCKLSSMD